MSSTGNSYEQEKYLQNLCVEISGFEERELVFFLLVVLSRNMNFTTPSAVSKASDWHSVVVM